MVNKRKPTHPGEVLREDVLVPLGLTVTEAARRLHMKWFQLQTYDPAPFLLN